MKLKRGFSLIELLVAVLIIGILTSLALPGYEKAKRKAHFTHVEMILRDMMQALDASLMANGHAASALYTGMVYIDGYKCSARSDYFMCDGGDEGVFGIYRGNKTFWLEWWPNDGKFTSATNNPYVLTRDMDQPWIWTNNGAYGKGINSYNGTFQMFCDWWIKQGGRPYSDRAKTIADANCSL